MPSTWTSVADGDGFAAGVPNQDATGGAGAAGLVDARLEQDVDVAARVDRVDQRVVHARCWIAVAALDVEVDVDVGDDREALRGRQAVRVERIAARNERDRRAGR